MYDWLNQIRRYAGVEGTTDDALLFECLGRATSQITQYVRRDLYGTLQGTVGYSRWVVKMQGPALYLDRDLYALGSITNGDGQNIPAGSVWLEPKEGPPYRIVRLKSTYVWTWNTDAEVQIVGGWGYGTQAPQDIEQATIRYASYLFRQKDVGVTDTSGYEASGEVQYTSGMPADVRWILSPYRSRTGGVV